MERALFLAERGRGRTTPNPMRRRRRRRRPTASSSGHGAHLDAGGPHAEVVALDDGRRAHARRARSTARSSRARTTGRTGPCVERIVAAGIARVVAAVTDPNPRVAGQGFAYLRAHGVEVVEGVGRQAALGGSTRRFSRWIRDGASVRHREDGRVEPTGSSAARERACALTGPAANRFFHRQRAEVDAMAVGSGRSSPTIPS